MPIEKITQTLLAQKYAKCSLIIPIILVFLSIESAFCWYEPKHPIDNLYIRSIALDSQFIWFGSQDIVSNHHGVFQYNKFTHQWETFCKATGLPDNRIQNIEVYRDSVIIYTWEEAMVYHKSSAQWTHLKGQGYKMFFPKKIFVKDNVYEIEGDSLIITEGKQKTVYKFPNELVNDSVNIKIREYMLTNIFFDDNKLWFGVNAVEFEPWWFGIGIACFDLSTKKWSFFQPNCLKYNSIACIAKDRNWLWFGTARFTEDGDFPAVGAIQYNKTTGEWRQFASKNSGIAGDAVFAILIDGSYIWFGTNRGISQYDRIDEKWRKYGITDWEIVGDSVKIYAGDGQSYNEENKSQAIGMVLKDKKPNILCKRYNWYEIQLSHPIIGWVPFDRIEIKKDSLGKIYGTLKLSRSEDMIKWDHRFKAGPGNNYPNLFYFDEKWFEKLVLGKKQNGWQQIILSTGWIDEKNVKCLISEIK